MGKVKYVAKSFCCETCNKLEEIKDKVREDGKTRHCSCTCGSAQVWVVKVPCWYCIGMESHRIATVKTVMDEYGCELGAYDVPYNFCPNCGRKIQGGTSK